MPTPIRRPNGPMRNSSDVLKGWIPERIVLRQLGGTVDDLGLFVGGQARFTVGETALVFLEVRPRDDSLYTTALWERHEVGGGGGAGPAASPAFMFRSESGS